MKNTVKYLYFQWVAARMRDDSEREKSLADAIALIWPRSKSAENWLKKYSNA